MVLAGMTSQAVKGPQPRKSTLDYVKQGPGKLVRQMAPLITDLPYYGAANYKVVKSRKCTVNHSWKS